jgi:predicted alpha/beta-hydrolase family hydrolase
VATTARTRLVAFGLTIGGIGAIGVEALEPDPGPEAIRATTARGEAIELLVDVPPGSAPDARHPALVVAPGQAYPREAPLLAELARAAVDVGYVVFRFDWAYTSRGGVPSPARTDEREDLDAALARARSDPRVDPAAVTLAGKSMGSLVAHAAFREDPDLAALLLLTPIGVPARGDEGSAPGAALEGRYPGLADETRPVVITVGTEDSLCPGPSLAGALATWANPAVVPLVFPGDHGLEVERGTGPEARAASARNVTAAARANAAWLGEIAARRR